MGGGTNGLMGGTALHGEQGSDCFETYKSFVVVTFRLESKRTSAKNTEQSEFWS